MTQCMNDNLIPFYATLGNVNKVLSLTGVLSCPNITAQHLKTTTKAYLLVGISLVTKYP